MKKTISVILCLFVICLFCFAEQNEKWSLHYWLDDFGDETTESYVEYLDGNTKLIFETGNHNGEPVVLLSVIDSISNKPKEVSYGILKVKDETGSIWEYSGSRRDSMNRFDNGILTLYCLLLTNNSLKCIAGTGNNTESFTINCDGVPPIIRDYVIDQFEQDNCYFGQNYSVKSFIIPDGVKTIAPSLFIYWGSLESITIPESVTSIGAYAFSGCSSLSKIVFSSNSSIERIEKGSFESCSSITSFEIPDSVTSIGSEAFRDCSGLVDLIIPNSVRRIELSAFRGCRSLKNVFVADLSSWLNISFEYSSNHSEANPMNYATNLYVDGIILSGQVEIPSGITNIPLLAFAKCKKITSLIIPSTVKTIDRFAFADCTLLSVISIPKSVDTFRYEPFYNCDALKTIIYNGTMNDWGKIQMRESISIPYDCIIQCTDGKL